MKFVLFDVVKLGLFPVILLWRLLVWPYILISTLVREAPDPSSASIFFGVIGTIVAAFVNMLAHLPDKPNGIGYTPWMVQAILAWWAITVLPHLLGSSYSSFSKSFDQYVEEWK